MAVALALGADPAPASAPAAPAPAATEPKKGNYLKLAAPPFGAVNLDEKVATFFSEHFAGALVRRGVQVLTPSEINAMIGLERSKQLAGCAEDASSCVAELSNALGVDGLVAGTVAKFGGSVQGNIKIFSARDGSALKAISFKASGEEQFLEELARQAAVAAPELLSKTGKEPAPTLEAEAKPVRANLVSFGAVPALVSLGFRIGRSKLQWYSLEYERVLYDWLGLYAAPTIISGDLVGAFRPPIGEGREGVITGIDLLRLEVGGRFYWPGSAPGGWFASPQLAVSSGNVVFTNYDMDGNTSQQAINGLYYSVGLSIGHRWYPWEMVPVVVALGWEFSPNGPSLPLGRLHVGYAW
jgi:hypothetical protein